MATLTDTLRSIVSSPLSIEILEGTFSDLSVNYNIPIDEIIHNLEINRDDWDK